MPSLGLNSASRDPEYEPLPLVFDYFIRLEGDSMFVRLIALLACTILFLMTTAVADQNIPAAICNDNRTPAGIVADGVLNVHLEARQAVWYPNQDGKGHLVVSAFAEEGHGPQIPGPFLRVPVGIEVSATI